MSVSSVAAMDGREKRRVLFVHIIARAAKRRGWIHVAVLVL
jgi:hypothetical protein